ncbi:hypothetical protein [Laspinema olomoucense]|uniref:Uncharacterized protein n=1 Tax=Laspinema olomoucense D3b TaxID=2953688 RepID=A0ABT2N0K8_9CYAN|nr:MULTISPECIES: hypothetical protein [unclassified Laspinema]MCT7970969.1 hypothetical protein [Laspinema sp. D3d]MCT7976213.1 hypothetical protein [Laspinema sp. D3b]MCT7989961.1 hypothetical protein [Laspinema sp. D3a]MCT7995716.1 hypothetical protein [Laspinema sp. D3c]
MIPSRLFRQHSRNRQTALAIIPLANEAATFDAYRLLQYHGISPEHLAIVGQGYSSPARVGLLEPTQIAVDQARRFLIGFATMGFLVGSALVLAYHLGLINPLGFNSLLLIPGVVAIAAVLGGVVGGLIGFLGEGSTVGVYHHHLRQGGYLLMIEGSQELVTLGEQVLKPYATPKAF